MTREDVLAYVNRDWLSIARVKTLNWLAAKSSPSDDVARADSFRQYVLRLRPDWPDAEERANDLMTHEKVSRALRAVIIRPR